MNKDNTTITVRFSVENRPLAHLYQSIADDRGISRNRMIENVLVSYMRDVREMSWLPPEEKEEPLQLNIIDELKKLEK